MKHISRRDFLTVAGAAPLGLTVSGCVSQNNTTQDSTASISPDALFDPWLEINTRHLAWNVTQVRKRVEGRSIMAVIKCNAYGHGLAETARIFGQEGIDKFAVVKIYEAVALRESGITGEILNFGGFTKQQAEVLVRHGISQSVFSNAVDHLAAAAQKLGKQAQIHIKVDTGLGRVGVPHDQAFAFIEKVAAMPDIRIRGIFTSLTEEADFDPVQVKRLLALADEAKSKGIDVGMRHAASSLGIANCPPAFLDMVRPGDALYGIEPLANMDLRQALSMKTRVIYVKPLRPGQSVGYHREFKIEKDTLLVTLPLGYSDGYPIAAVNRSDVLIHGRHWPMIGSISANHVFVDVTGSEGIQIGDEVVLFGNQGEESITMGEVAQWGGTSVYKIAILTNPLLPRLFV